MINFKLKDYYTHHVDFTCELDEFTGELAAYDHFLEEEFWQKEPNMKTKKDIKDYFDMYLVEFDDE